ncbi:MAG: hypothetical protein JNL02_12025 [Saprospiraceae bacterium]|nr:hypothetical protein [Saprospiraceae bacterium]
MFRLPILFLTLLYSACVSFGQSPGIPANVIATPYERHIELRWTTGMPAASEYQVYRSVDGIEYTLFKTVYPPLLSCIDWTGDEGLGLTRHYKVKAVSGVMSSDFSNPATATTFNMTDEQLLDMTQQYTLRYFWDYGHPVSGLARERSNGNDDIVTTGGSGFGIMALIVGVERGWITREAAVNRMVQIVSFLQVADRYHGVYPHWLDGNTGNTVPFSQYDNGADLVETAFLMQGLLAARQYFNQNDPLENAIRDVITILWEDVEWDWFRKNNGPVLYWHWSPNYGWQMNFPLRGFFEAQIVYILAAASPTHPVPASLYQTGWTAGNYANNASYYGYPIYCGPYGGGPMFFAHYSYLGFDPRGKKDAFCNYFVRNRNHALIQVAYALANPENHEGYGANCWGLTSCDGPNGYSAHDVNPQNDNGTVAPTAALASMPYVPAESMNALRYFYRELGQNLWGRYGFYDAFNLDQNWVAPSYLAIDQGPIVVMIENHRSGLFWDLFMANPEIQPALDAIGFVPNSTGTAAAPQSGFTARISPNPALPGAARLFVETGQPLELTARYFSADGSHALPVFSKRDVSQSTEIQLPNLPQGIGWLLVSDEKGHTQILKILTLSNP